MFVDVNKWTNNNSYLQLLPTTSIQRVLLYI